MKKILLVNIDSTIKNLALAKIKKYHLDLKDTVEEIDTDTPPLGMDQYDKVYVSCIFTKNKHLCEQFKGDNVVIGGTGYDVSISLPDEIENIKPKINLGFTTRGCIRKCKFCFVPAKEGNIHVVGDLYDVWDGKKKPGKLSAFNRDVTLLDNNILAAPEHFAKICAQARRHDIRLDFNQGIDIRLTNEDIAKELKQTSTKDIRFALDHPSTIPIFEKKLTMLRSIISEKFQPFVYVIVGFDTTWEEDMRRLEFLRERKCRPYLMRHEKCYDKKEYNVLARWVNKQDLFQAMTWDEFNDYDKNKTKKAKDTKKQNAIQYDLFSEVQPESQSENPSIPKLDFN